MPRNFSARPTRQTKPRSRKKLLIAAVVLAVVLLGVGAGLWAHTRTNKSEKVIKTASGTELHVTPATKDDNAPSEDRKSSSTPSQTLIGNNTSSDPVPFSTTISSANVNNGNIHVGTLVNGVTSGSCSLTLSQAGKQSVVKTSTVQLNVNNYDCGVFNIATSELPSGGDWKVTLTVTNNGQTASNSATVTI